MFARRTILTLLASSALVPMAFVEAAPASRKPFADGIDWASFLKKHDMVWDRMPKAWDEGPLLGNGMLGALVYQDKATGQLRIDLGRSDVHDHRRPFKNANFDNARLPIGHFLLKTKGKLTGACSLRLSLHDATVSGEIATDQGRIAIRAYVHADHMAIVAEARGIGGERDASWDFVGEEAISPRQSYGIATKEPTRMLPGYQNNPAGTRTSDGADQLWLQPLNAGGGTATAWRIDRGRVTASIAHSYPGDGAKAQALGWLRTFLADRTAEQRHRKWWHDFYPASFVSIPDARVESFYWIQLYKLASATRADRALIDNQGPWLVQTAWPSAWWNLNVQLTYWTPVASNHADLAMSLVNTLKNNQAALVENVEPQFRADAASMARTSSDDLVSPVQPPDMRDKKPTEMTGMASVGRAPEVANLPWALHNVWLVWRHTMDEAVLRDTLFPLLRRTTNYYRHFLTKGDDGKLHLPVTYSPELASAPDLNYDLALLRWSCGALIEAAARLKIDDPLLPEWRRIQVNLVDYPVDSTGFMIGAGLPLTKSHRHYSHLLMAYPLYLVNAEQPGGAALIDRSVRHWQSMPSQLLGYSQTGAASLTAAIGDGDRALGHLKRLFGSFLRPNTLYKESGPVIETPLSGAQAVLDMLIQSWGGAIRPFPAVPSAWADCTFADLSAEGGFLVSAERKGGATRWVQIFSKAGEPFAIKTDIKDPVASVNGRLRPLVPGPNGHLIAAVAKGETIVIHPRGSQPDMVVRAVASVGAANSFGLNANNAVAPGRDNVLPADPAPQPKNS